MDEIEILPVRLGKGTFICYDDDFAWVDDSNRRMIRGDYSKARR